MDKKVDDSNKEKILFSISFPTDRPELPDPKYPEKIDVRYKVIDPYATIHIYWHDETHELVYEVEEPEMSKEEIEELKLIESGLIELMNISFVNINDEKVIISYLEKSLKVLITELNLKFDKEKFLKFMYYIWRDFIGLDRVEPLMHDYFIEDIECNGVKTPIYIVHRLYRNLRTNVIFNEMDNMVSFVEKLAQKCGQYVSYANPLLDGSLPDGTRVNATYTEDITSRGPTFTLRKFTKEPWTPIKLMDFKTVSPEILAYLWMIVENKSSILVIGGTGSGKTSLLNAIAFFIPPAARVVSIEDTRELNLKHENWLPGVARAGMGGTAEGGGIGGVTLFDLLKESLRQRPDYIIVGEIRGKEAYVMFQAMASGHPAMATMHAESVDTVAKRLVTPPISLSPALIEALDAVCFITPAKIGGRIVRRLKEVSEIISVSSDGKVQIEKPFIWKPGIDKFLFKTQSHVFQKILDRTGMTWDQLLVEFKRRSNLLFELYKRKIFGFEEVQNVIQEYYKNPQAVLKRFGIK